MAITIRRLRPGDEAVLETLAHDAPEFDLPGLSEPDEPLSAEKAAGYLSSSWVLHWIAEEEGRVVGELLCHVLPLPFGEGKELLLYSIGVRQKERRHGIGRTLVETMFGWMKAESISVVWVLADNPGAEAFYAACGFTRGEGRDQGTLMVRTFGA